MLKFNGDEFCHSCRPFSYFYLGEKSCLKFWLSSCFGSMKYKAVMESVSEHMCPSV